MKIAWYECSKCKRVWHGNGRAPLCPRCMKNDARRKMRSGLPGPPRTDYTPPDLEETIVRLSRRAELGLPLFGD